MIETSFRSFFGQASEQIILKEQQEGVLQHLTHLEELVLTSKKQGLDIAIQFLKELYDTLKGKTDSKTFVGVKWDGCVHPETKIVTNKGPLLIDSIIDNFNKGEKYSVIGFDTTMKKNILTEVTNAVKTIGVKQWIELELENGDTFKCTEDHEIYTENRGWIRAKDLTTEDNLKFLL